MPEFHFMVSPYCRLPARFPCLNRDLFLLFHQEQFSFQLESTVTVCRGPSVDEAHTC